WEPSRQHERKCRSGQGRTMSADLISSNDLAGRINAAHEEVKKALWRGAEQAIEAGRLLLQAKATVRHGNWLEWVGANCRFSERTAQLYMRLAEEAPRLETKTQRIADLTVNDAIKLLEPLKSPEEPRILPGRRGKRRDPVLDAIKNGPLAILQRAWEAPERTSGKYSRSRLELRLTWSLQPNEQPLGAPQRRRILNACSEKSDRVALLGEQPWL